MGKPQKPEARCHFSAATSSVVTAAKKRWTHPTASPSPGRVCRWQQGLPGRKADQPPPLTSGNCFSFLQAVSS